MSSFLLLRPLFETDGALFNSGFALVVLTLTYLPAMWLVTRYRPKQQPQWLTGLSFVHNCVLSLFSLYCFLGVALQLWANVASSSLSLHSIFVCDTSPERVLMRGSGGGGRPLSMSLMVLVFQGLTIGGTSFTCPRCGSGSTLRCLFFAERT
jgi:hypothetical protein